MSSGWFKLHRAIKEHWIWQDSEKFKWWIDLLMRANYCDKKLLLGNSAIDIKRGSLFVSVVNLAKEWGVDRKTVMRFLNLLEKEAMVKVSANRYGTIIHILNYEEYQGLGDEGMKEEQVKGKVPLKEDNKGYKPKTPMEGSKRDKEEIQQKSVEVKVERDNDYVITADGRIKKKCESVHNPTYQGNSEGNQGVSVHKTAAFEGKKDNQRDNSLHSKLHRKEDNQWDNRKDSYCHSKGDTSNNINNINNINNLNNDKKENKGKKEITSGKRQLAPLTFPTESHKKIYNSFGEITYRTWFMNTDIDLEEGGGAKFKVRSEFMETVLRDRFKEPLTALMGRQITIGLIG